MNKKLWPALLILMILGGLVLARSLNGGEDNWLCENGGWVAHGNPSSAKPGTGCGPAATVTAKVTVSDEQILNDIKLDLVIKYNKADKMVLALSDKDETHAKGSVNFTNEGGGIWLGTLIDGKWTLVYDGNGIADCALVDKYQFSNKMVPGCIEVDNNNKFKQR